MLEYIGMVKRAFRDQLGFQPLPGSTESEPLLDVPDGKYALKIDGKTDNVEIKGGKIHCCNFEEPAQA